jgi:hypothetical protein
LTKVGRTVIEKRSRSEYTGASELIATRRSTTCWIGAVGAVGVSGGKTADCSESSEPSTAMLSTAPACAEVSRSRT